MGTSDVYNTEDKSPQKVRQNLGFLTQTSQIFLPCNIKLNNCGLWLSLLLKRGKPNKENYRLITAVITENSSIN